METAHSYEPAYRLANLLISRGQGSQLVSSIFPAKTVISGKDFGWPLFAACKKLVCYPLYRVNGGGNWEGNN